MFLLSKRDAIKSKLVIRNGISKGYASEAVKSILNFSFNNVNFHKVQVCHKEGNIASQGVIRKCNFTYEGTLRDFFFMDGRYINRLYYSMLKDEYEKYK